MHAKKKWFLFTILIFLIAAFFGVLFSLRYKPGNIPPPDRSVKTEYGVPIKVRRVIDGDTIELVNGDRLRYIGIDTPEEVDPRKPVQCFAREAAARNKNLVEGKEILFY